MSGHLYIKRPMGKCARSIKAPPDKVAKLERRAKRRLETYAGTFELPGIGPKIARRTSEHKMVIAALRMMPPYVGGTPESVEQAAEWGKARNAAKRARRSRR